MTVKEPIKVGDYVRIKHMYSQTKIAKITKILEKDPCYHDMQMYQIDVVHQHSNGHFPAYKIYEEDIIDYSSEIIELVQVGDYVNGYRVIDVVEDLKTKEIHLEMPMDYTNKELGDCTIYNKDIKSILTKENFDAMNYVIGKLSK